VDVVERQAWDGGGDGEGEADSGHDRAEGGEGDGLGQQDVSPAGLGEQRGDDGAVTVFAADAHDAEAEHDHRHEATGVEDVVESGAAVERWLSVGAGGVGVDDGEDGCGERGDGGGDADAVGGGQLVDVGSDRVVHGLISWLMRVCHRVPRSSCCSLRAVMTTPSRAAS
jgi:hypothetical protein